MVRGTHDRALWVLISNFAHAVAALIVPKKHFHLTSKSKGRINWHQRPPAARPESRPLLHYQLLHTSPRKSRWECLWKGPQTEAQKRSRKQWYNECSSFCQTWLIYYSSERKRKCFLWRYCTAAPEAQAQSLCAAGRVTGRCPLGWLQQREDSDSLHCKSCLRFPQPDPQSDLTLLASFATEQQRLKAKRNDSDCIFNPKETPRLLMKMYKQLPHITFSYLWHS